MKTPRVLVVNDDPSTNLLHAEIVRMRGYDVSVAVDGAQAVAACLAEPPDAIILDVQMPIMDGIAAATEIARLHRTGKLPYIAIVGTSAGMDSLFGDACRAAGMIATHQKPVDFERLGKSIDSAIRLTQLQRSSSV